jgi:hypothetical protein
MENNIELSNYQEKKQKIKTGLIRITQGFVEVGYELKQIRDQELYKLDGYGSITEFARAEYGLEHWDTSRFIAINDKYAEGPKLLAQYEGYKYGLLAEMLSMSEEELKLVSLRTTRAEIRDIKVAKREAETGERAPAHVMESLENTQSESDTEGVKKTVIPEGDKLLIEFFRDKSRRGILKELAAVFEAGITREAMTKAPEIINPSGHMMFRKGLVILIFEEDRIKYSKFGGESRDFLYANLIMDIFLIFDMSMPDPWVAFYGEPEPDPIPDPPKKEAEKQGNAKPAAKIPDKKPEKAVNTQSGKASGLKQTKEETTDPADDNLPGQIDITEYKECMPELDAAQERTINDLDLSVRTHNCLARAGILKLEDLCGMTRDEVSQIHNVGKGGMDEIRIRLRVLGLDLKENDIDIHVPENDNLEIVDNLSEIVNDVEESNNTTESFTGYEEGVDESYNFANIPRASDRLVTILAKLFVEKEGKRLIFGRATLMTPTDDEITYMFKSYCRRETVCIDNGVEVSAGGEIIEFSRGDEDLGICLYQKFANHVRKRLDECIDEQLTETNPLGQEKQEEEGPAEIIEADIVHTPAAAEQKTMKLDLREASGEVEVLISRSKGVRLIST